MGRHKNITPIGFRHRSGLKSNSLWKYGQKSTIAKIVGMSRQQLNGILAGKSRARPEDAASLQKAALRVGQKIPALDWIYSKETRNPLFNNGVDYIASFDDINSYDVAKKGLDNGSEETD